GNEYFAFKRLGAFGSEVAVLSAFFDPPWETLAPGLSEPTQAFVLNHAGVALRALGRLAEAAGLLRMAQNRRIAQKNWRDAPTAASNLSELLQVRGDLREAREQAEKSVELANKSGDVFEHIVSTTTLAPNASEAASAIRADFRHSRQHRLDVCRLPRLSVCWKHRPRICQRLRAGGEAHHDAPSAEPRQDDLSFVELSEQRAEPAAAPRGLQHDDQMRRGEDQLGVGQEDPAPERARVRVMEPLGQRIAEGAERIPNQRDDPGAQQQRPLTEAGPVGAAALGVAARAGVEPQVVH